MNLKNEQRSAIKFCCWLKNSAVETVKLMHKAYTDEKSLGDLTIFHWHNVFSEGSETAALLPHVGRPLRICSEKMVNRIAVIVCEDCHITVRQLAHALDISKSSVHTILCRKLKMRRVTACWVPHFLIQEQRDCCIEICHEWLKRIEDERNVVGHVITGDERWIHYFNPATKEESMH